MVNSATVSNKLCECGCGRLVPIAIKTRASRGYRKGEPQRFIHGHVAPKPETVDYRRGHKLKLHRVKAEAALGRPLPPTAVVHHTDCTKSDHSPLVICQDHAYHMLLHVRTRIVRAGGDPNTQALCCRCGLQPLENFWKATNRPQGVFGYCKACVKVRRGADGPLAYRLRDAK